LFMARRINSPVAYDCVLVIRLSTFLNSFVMIDMFLAAQMFWR
jgi:hypothetical protein